MTSNPVELAWLAGLFDGEGSVGLYMHARKSGTTVYQLRVSLRMSHRPTVERFVELVGPGYVRSQWDGNANHRRTFEWVITGPRARAFLEAVIPYSFTKRDEMQLAIDAENLRWESCVMGSRGRSRESQLKLVEMAAAVKALKGYNFPPMANNKERSA